MNMPAFNINQGFDSFIQDELAMINAMNEARVREMMNYGKEFLDKVFPLAEGSHKDVSSYVIYFQHMLAFFPDGSKSGLKDPKQFVALSGHKSEPTSIVLKNNGFHVEIIFDENGVRGSKDAAGIDDIQVETSLLDPEQGTHQWFSMIRGENIPSCEESHSQQVQSFCVKKEFTDKDGEDYILN